MSTVIKEKKVTATHCVGCEGELTKGVCLNINCPEAQKAAVANATGRTHKATAKVATDAGGRTRTQPRAWTNTGRVD